MAVSFAVAGWYAWRALGGRRDPAVRAGLAVAMIVGGVSAVLQPISGDLLAKFVFETQPVKFAAMEGQFLTQTHAPLRIGGWPEVEAGATHYALEIPGGLSYLATRDPAAEVPGLDRAPRSDWPNVEITHLAFQIMVISGVVLAAVSLWSCVAFLRTSKDLLERRWLLRALVFCMPLGFIGLEAGWFVTEVGRQPWIIQGVMRVGEAVTPAEGVVTMFILFSLLYAILGLTVIVLLRRLASGNA
jgi:cytochrome d ubiquinol oxidase subunit I